MILELGGKDPLIVLKDADNIFDFGCEVIVKKVINEYPNEVQAFKNGKTKLLGFFVGQLMKRTKGKADPKLANKLLMEKLNS